MSLEFDFISRVVHDGDLDTPLEAGITADFLYTSQTRRAWKWLHREFYQRASWGVLPSAKHFRGVFPKFPYDVPPESVQSLTQRLVANRAKIEQIRLYEDAIDRLQDLEEDALGVLQDVQDGIHSMCAAYTDNEILSLARSGEMLRERYEIRSAGGLVGVPYPWEPLNIETGGAQKGEWIVFYGLTGHMKSWLTIAVAEYAYTAYNQRVLFYTREMEVAQVAQRCAARMARANYTQIVRGTLPPEKEKEYFDSLNAMLEFEEGFHSGDGGKFFLITSDRQNPRGGGVSALQGLIKRYEPQLVVVDGAYLMLNDRSGKQSMDWKDLLSISQDIKGTAQNFGVPIIGSMQANDKERVFGARVEQDADLVLRVEKVPLEGDGARLILRFPKARETPVSGFILDALPAVYFRFLQQLRDDDVGEEKEDGEREQIFRRRKRQQHPGR